MSQFFNLTRFTRLLNMHWIENRRFYLLSWLVLIAIGIIICTMAFATDRSFLFTYETQMIFYFFGLFAFMIIHASRGFQPLARKESSMHYLSIPASHFEKFLMGFLVIVVGGFIAYTLAFYIVDMIFVKLSEVRADKMSNNVPEFYQYRIKYFRDHPKYFNCFTLISDLLKIDGRSNRNTEALKEMRVTFFNIYTGVVGVSGLFAFGSAGLGRNSFFKTLLLTFIIGCVYGLLVTTLAESAPEPFDGFMDSLHDWSSDRSEVVIKQSPIIWTFLSYFLVPIMTILLWTATYYRIKEKQV
jgi:hypothetical protein